MSPPAGAGRSCPAKRACPGGGQIAHLTNCHVTTQDSTQMGQLAWALISVLRSYHTPPRRWVYLYPPALNHCRGPGRGFSKWRLGYPRSACVCRRNLQWDTAASCFLMSTTAMEGTKEQGPGREGSRVQPWANPEGPAPYEMVRGMEPPWRL